MKIMVYTHGIPLNQTYSKRKEILDKKKAELKTEYPHLNVMVIPGPESEGDKVFVADMTYYGPQTTFPNILAGAGAAAGILPTSYPPNWTVGGYGGGHSTANAGSIYSGPVTGTTANVVHYMDDQSMFKMDAGPSGFEFSTVCTTNDKGAVDSNVVQFPIEQVSGQSNNCEQDEGA